MFNLSKNEFLKLRSLIEEESGIYIADDKAYLIESKLASLLVENMCFSFDEFCILLERNKPGLIEKIINAITINETLWFRDNLPWNILEESLIINMLDIIRKEKRKVRIWSCASSTGQEIYSIVMIITDFLEKNQITDVTLNDFEFIATDISSSVLNIAKNARYDAISMKRGISELRKLKYFKSEKQKVWELNNEIKKNVKFLKLNLKKDFSYLGKFDIILCRYVLIYFTSELKKDVLDRINNVLQDDGLLFLGGGEIFSDVEDKYTIEFHNGNCYYKKVGG